MEPGLDWDRWLGPAPKVPYNSTLSPRGDHNHFPAWRRYREYAGGSVADFGAHHYDIAQWGLGTDDTGPVDDGPVMEILTASLDAGALLSAWSRGDELLFVGGELSGNGAG